MSADRSPRLSIATRLAAGMLANPATYAMQSYEAVVARSALRIADRMIAQHESDVGAAVATSPGIAPLPHMRARPQAVA